MTVSGPPDDYTTQLKEAGYRLFAAKNPDQQNPSCETCGDDPEVCASVPGLRHCEKAGCTDQQSENECSNPDCERGGWCDRCRRK